MIKPAKIRTITICVLLAWQIAVAEQRMASVDETSQPDQEFNLQIVLYPPQTEMHGPYPFRQNPLVSFAGIGQKTSFLHAVIAGAALIDGTIALSRRRPAMMKTIASTQILGSSFDYQQTIMNGLDQLQRVSDLVITAIEPFKFDKGSRMNARWIIQNSDADYVLYFKPIYYMTPELDRLRMRVTVDLYSRQEEVTRPMKLFRRNYEYLSASRGNLFRPFDEGEKKALTTMIEDYFEYKVEQFPHNLRAYKKDRNQALRALRGRDTILPTMAISEGWSEESLASEILSATNHVIFMIRQDLEHRHSDISSTRSPVNFTALTVKGNPRTYKGSITGRFDSITLYRDKDGNMFSLPPSSSDAE